MFKNSKVSILSLSLLFSFINLESAQKSAPLDDKAIEQANKEMRLVFGELVKQYKCEAKYPYLNGLWYDRSRFLSAIFNQPINDSEATILQRRFAIICKIIDDQINLAKNNSSKPQDIAEFIREMRNFIEKSLKQKYGYLDDESVKSLNDQLNGLEKILENIEADKSESE